MITVGSEVKINVEALEENGFLHLNETEISFIKENKDTVFTVSHDWINTFSYVEYPYSLNAIELEGIGFKSNELILVEGNA